MYQVDVSVVIATRNAADYMPTVFAHLENQSFPAARFEVIIVDDGSTDATTEVLQGCCAGSPMPIRVIHQEESGFPVALNRGVHEATGRWIVFLDHDLLASPQLIARHVRAQERLGGEACIVGRVAVHPKLKGGALTRFLMPQERYTLVENEALSFLDWRRANMSLSRKILLAHGGLDEKFSLGHFDDSDLGVRLAEHGIKAYFVDNAYAYAWRPESLITLRSRYYDMGYSLQRLVEKTQSREIYQRYDIAPSRLRHLGEVIAMPFYLRACRQPKERALFFPRLYKRIFSHDIYTGYTDAQKHRPPRQHRR